MKTYRWAQVQLHSFLTSTLDGGDSSTACTITLFPGKSPSVHWIGGWVGLRARLDILEKRRVSCPGIHYMKYTIPAPMSWRTFLCSHFILNGSKIWLKMSFGVSQQPVLSVLNVTGWGLQFWRELVSVYCGCTSPSLFLHNHWNSINTVQWRMF